MTQRKIEDMFCLVILHTLKLRRMNDVTKWHCPIAVLCHDSISDYISFVWRAFSLRLMSIRCPHWFIFFPQCSLLPSLPKENSAHIKENGTQRTWWTSTAPRSSSDVCAPTVGAFMGWRQGMGTRTGLRLRNPMQQNLMDSVYSFCCNIFLL